jgi:uncharacterized membrane protein YidH (DUF202 family)
MQGWSWQSIRGGPASRWLVIDLVEKMDAYWRAANHLSVGQVYLKDNSLLDSRSNWKRNIAGLNRSELASPPTADGGRPAPISRSMIRNFADHSANERTFLAWVRTAIAVMAFGFIVEKFDLFLEVAAPSLGGRPLSLPGHRFGNIAGLALIALGIAMVAVAAARFLIMAKTSTAKSSTPVWARASISHSPPCSSC